MIAGHICITPLYEYTHDGKTWRFEFSHSAGPWPVRQDGELFSRAGDKFYSAFEAWASEHDRERYRIGGGCFAIGGE